MSHTSSPPTLAPDLPKLASPGLRSTWRQPRGLHWGTVTRLLSDSFQTKATAVQAFICVADHYEPIRGQPPKSVQQQRVDRWHRDYPPSVAGLADCRGRPPQHTFFYPAEEYAPEYLEICVAGAWGT